MERHDDLESKMMKESTSELPLLVGAFLLSALAKRRVSVLAVGGRRWEELMADPGNGLFGCLVLDENHSRHFIL